MEDKKKEKKESPGNKHIDLEPDTDKDVSEALTLAQRRKRAVAFRRSKVKRKRGMERSKRKMANREKLQKRARKKAIELIRKRVAGSKGDEYKKLSPSERMMIDKKVEKRKGAIEKLARKMFPKVKKAEVARLRKERGVRKEGYLDEGAIRFYDLVNFGRFLQSAMENYFRKAELDELVNLAEFLGKKVEVKGDGRRKRITLEGVEYDDPMEFLEALAYTRDDKPRKRFHMMMNGDMSMKHDKRFRFNRKNAYEVNEDNLIESVDQILEDLDLSERKFKFTPNKSHTGGNEGTVTMQQLKDLEKFGDRLLDKFGIDIEFTKHFAERMNHPRNNPPVKISEIQSLFKQIAKNKGKNIKANSQGEVVLQKMQTDLNIPVVIKYDRNKDELTVVHKTVMRKKGFKSPDKFVRYEETEHPNCGTPDCCGEC